MSVSWYYVEGKDRVGPVDELALEALVKAKRLKGSDYVWKKGFDNWKRLEDVEELRSFLYELPPIVPHSPPVEGGDSVRWDEIDPNEKIFSIKIGADRGAPEQEFGPYSLNILVKAFKQKRINGKTYIFTPGMGNWSFLADIPIYESLFSEMPPMIQVEERRKHVRKPFVARIFFHDNNELLEGICRDISVGGLQILTPHFPGKVGDEVSMNVHPDNSDYNFVAKGQVVRVLEGAKGCSLRFDSLSDQAKVAIETYIKSSAA